MTQTRSKRFVRPPKEELEPYDPNNPIARRVLEELAQYRCLRQKFLVMLVSEYSRSAVLDHLRLLYHHEYVQRLDIFHHKYTGWNDSAICEISNKGLKYLEKQWGVVPSPVMFTRGNKYGLQHEQLGHTMMIADLMANIQPGRKKAGHEMRTLTRFLERRMQKRLNKAVEAAYRNKLSIPTSFRHTFEDGHVGTYQGRITPDTIAVFVSPERQRTVPIECEHKSKSFRNNFADSSTFRKILSYENLTVEDMIYFYGCSEIHVLFACASEVEMHNAMAKGLAAIGPSERYLFAHVEAQETLMRNPQPNPGFYEQPLLRLGLPPIALKDI